MFSIELDYSYDKFGFFNNPSRREAVAYAAELWASIIQDDFNKIPAGSAFEIRHPSIDGSTIDVTLAEDVDDLIIFVGARDISGNTLALGGPSGYSLVGDEFYLRVADNFRDKGPSKNFEPWAGVLTFDTGTNWNYSLKPPSSDQNDLLTVALHEIGHVLGIGTSSTFKSFVNDQEFTGTNTVTLNSYALPLSQDKSHVSDNYNENNVLMDPSTTIGDRVQISEIDKAILSDLGYLIDGFLDQASTFDLATSDSETISGTLLDDLIDALAGNDTIFGNHGDDAIYGGLGDDQVQGGTGNDQIFGQGGDDTLFGQEGDDKIYGGEGSDQIQGGMGNDLLYGGDGDDYLYGDDGNDILLGEFGSDQIQSGSGDDIIVSEFGVNNIWTGDGSDKIILFCNGNETWLNDFEVLDDILSIVGSNQSSSVNLLETAYREYSNYWTIDLNNNTKLRVKGEDDKFLSANIEFMDDISLEDLLSKKKIVDVSSEAIHSTDVSEIFNAQSSLTAFHFKKLIGSKQGQDVIRSFDQSKHKIIFENYLFDKITLTLDSSGNDYFVFTEDAGESSVTIEASEVATSLKIKNLSSKNLQIDGVNFNVGVAGELSLASKTSVDDVKVEGLNSFKTGLRKSGDTNASDPINLSDVLAQLKHIIGLKELKNQSFHAGDNNNDGTVDLSDVLVNLKHIIGLKEIDSFDLVTDNGFAINSLNTDSAGNLTLLINGDADQSHAEWDFF